MEELPDKIQRNDTKFEYLKEDMVIPQHNNKGKNIKSKMNEMKNTTQNVKIQFNSEKKILDKH